MGRKLGQHFLASQPILKRIAGAVCPNGCDLVVEIGPGKGALTAHLLPLASRVIAVEIDAELARRLPGRFPQATHLEVLHEDVLRSELDRWGPVTVAGNLPYYITSPIIEKTLKLGPLLKLAVFLVQNEVADRLTAGPGSGDYGYLSVRTQLACEPRTLFRVPPTAFRPPPKVDSAVVALRPRTEPLLEEGSEAFLRFAGRCFRQRRKTLRNNLASEYPGIAAQPEAGLRAQQLTVTELIGLFQRIGG